MTDNEIIKALKILIDKVGDCDDVYFDGKNSTKLYFLLKGASELINRLKVENERLKEEKHTIDDKFECQQSVYLDLSRIIKKQADELKTAKSEARKEFAERLKNKIDCDVHLSEGFYFMVSDAINNLLVEMEKEDKT